MSDLIDRQAAIDAPVKMVSEGLDWIPVYHIKDLPSAQPDMSEYSVWLWRNAYECGKSDAQEAIIRCKDCAKCQIDTVFHDYWCDGRKVWKDHYCGYAERQTDE